MVAMLTHAKKGLLTLHRSEQGAEGLEKLLILAAIALPLLGVLLIFRNQIRELLTAAWQNMTGKGSVTDAGNPSLPIN